MIPRHFISEKPRIVPWPESLRAKYRWRFEASIGEPETDDFASWPGVTIEDAVARLAEVVAQSRLYDAHRARSWSE